jgi:hypothetical protein
MEWVVGVLGFLVIAIIVWFVIPISPMKSEFLRFKKNQDAGLPPSGEVFTRETITGLPIVLQRYLQKCGYIGKPIMRNIKINHNDVDFILNGKPLKITCMQYNAGNRPDRLALIDTRLFGIPFRDLIRTRTASAR